MIKKLSILNFQSHKNSVLEFDPNVNIIIGATDSGKTAILRALRLLITNRPGGNSYCSTWGGDTEVSIVTNEGDTIKRYKGKENIYKLNDLEFKAFGTDVPEEINIRLNFGNICLQRQFDQPFLLTESPGSVAAFLNLMAHIDKIDSSIKKVQSEIKSIEQDISSNQKQITKLNEELLGYSYLEKMEIELEVLEQLEKDLIQTNNQSNKLHSLIDGINNTISDIEGMNHWLVMEVEVKALLSDYALIESIEKEIESISRLCDRLSFTEKQILDKSKVLDLEPLIKPILDLYEQKESIIRQKKELTVLIEWIIRVESNIQTINNTELPKLQKQFDKEMGDTCILCGQKIKHNHEK